MVNIDVTRRGVMKGVGVMTSIRLASGISSARRETATEPAEDSTPPVGTDIIQDGWPQSGGTAAQTGRREGAIGPKSTVAYRWRIDGNPVISGVAVSSDIVYASDETALRALSANDGTEMWAVSIGDEYSHRTTLSTPAVDDTLVYVGETRKQAPNSAGNDELIGGSRVLALDATTGEREWQFEPERRASEFYSPTIEDGIVYVIGRNFGAGSVGLLYALDDMSGELLWKRETGTSGIAGYEAPPVAVENGTVYLASNELSALDAQTGKTYWSSDTDRSGTYRATGENAPAVAHGRVYVGYGTHPTFEAHHIADGSCAWTHTLTRDHDEKTRTGMEIESESRPRSEIGRWTGAAVDNDTVYVGYNSHSDIVRTAIYAFESNSGSIRWRTTFSDDPVYTPAIADGVLYTGRAALSVDDGSILWRLDGPTHTDDQLTITPGLHSSSASPAISDGTVYVGGTTLRAIVGW